MTINEWAHSILPKADQKLKAVVTRNAGRIPYSSVDGRFDDYLAKDKYWWTNGFWPGMLWIMFERTGDATYADNARKLEELMDAALTGDTEYGLHHDVGFMWQHLSVAHHSLDGNADSKRRGLLAANLLAGRFNPRGSYLVAWNGVDKQGWSIIDTMMNLPLLYWATEVTGYERFRAIAKIHADKTITNAIRPDGSVNHIVEYNPENGEFVCSHAGQGYAADSSWTRGQAWAVYGFALSYRHTGDKHYLDAAKRVAHYFMSALSDDLVAPLDFRAPSEPRYKDSSAGAITACGLIELSELVNEHEKSIYFDAAVNILRALEQDYCDWNPDVDPILSHGSEAYNAQKHISLIYGDYFFLESVARLAGMTLHMW